MRFILVFALYGLAACGESPSAGGAAVTLHWEPPTLSEDGSDLNDLEGFRVYYGTVEPLTKENAKQLKVDKALKSQLIGGLFPGIYFFAVTAVDTSGNESVFSEVISADISGV